MAERLKEKLVDKNKSVDIVVGPDAYRDLPRLIQALNVRTFGFFLYYLLTSPTEATMELMFSCLLTKPMQMLFL